MAMSRNAQPDKCLAHQWMQIKQKQQRLSASATKRWSNNDLEAQKRAHKSERGERGRTPRPFSYWAKKKKYSFEKGAYVEQENEPWDASEDVILLAI